MSATPANPPQAHPVAPDRFERRKAATRASLVRAARDALALGSWSGVGVRELAAGADVGLATFYQHFATKGALLVAAVDDIEAEVGDLLEAATSDICEPAALLAVSVRTVAKMILLAPALVLAAADGGAALKAKPGGLAARAHRDISAGVAAGRFRADTDTEVVVAMLAGSLLAAAVSAADSSWGDRVTAQLLICLGVDSDEAISLATAPLSTAVEAVAATAAAWAGQGASTAG